jgi:hypothetical protein
MAVVHLGMITLRQPWPRAALAVVAVASGVATALAQERLPIDPLAGRYRRELREVERRSATDPAEAARLAAQTRRRLIDDNGGVGLPPERARIDRELGRFEDGPASGTEAVRLPAGPELRSGLPSSYDDDLEELPSMTREIRLVSRLLDRAAQGIVAQDATQVSSDLAAARASMAGLRSAGPAAEVDALNGRLDGLQRQLAGLAPDGTAPP